MERKKLKENLRIGTLNLQGGNKKKYMIADDMVKYNISILCTTETRISGKNAQKLKTTDKKNTFLHYISGKEKNTRYRSVNYTLSEHVAKWSASAKMLTGHIRTHTCTHTGKEIR